LAKRKLLPALYSLYRQKLLPEHYAFLGYARTDYSEEEYRQEVRNSMETFANRQLPDDEWAEFARHIHYQSGGYDDRASFERLAARVAEIDEQHHTDGNRLFYLSTPPSVFKPITSLISEVGLSQTQDGGWARMIIEKPFGHDLASAVDLNQHLLSHFDENQIYRIDHYLGKETVQNILVFRFGNGIFEPIWNRNYVDHVQITVAESLGVEDRGGYYDKAGAIRDMIQNHVMQLVALTAMEPPVAYDDKAVRDQKVNVLRAIRPFEREDVAHCVVRAQYGSGKTHGETIPGYLDAPGVPSDSTTETYVAWRLEIDNWRWNGVPFYIRTGKAMATKLTEINVVFRRPPLMFFEDLDNATHIPQNVITLRIQPDEGIRLSFDAKRPGPIIDVNPVSMEFTYADAFGVEPAEAYERLLLDALLGDGTLFIRRDEVEVAWHRVTKVLEGWEMEEEAAGETQRLPTYRAGSWGPEAADKLLAAEGRYWRNPYPSNHSSQ
jgi:glucose-6-phosphate 1-dehydrogenase